MRPIDADAIVETLKDARKKADSPRRDLDILILQEMIQLAPTIAPPPNDPLTLEELREMDGDPVWICDPDGTNGMWALVDLEYKLCRTSKGGIAIFDTYGKTWLAYRRKPEAAACE